MSLKGIYNIHSGDGFPLCVFGVGDSIPDDIFEEDLQHASGFFVDEPAYSLDTTSSRQSSDCWLGDSLDIIAENLTMSLGASLSESLSSFTSTGHDDDDERIVLRA